MSAIADGCFVTFCAVLFSPSVFICPDRHTAVQDIDYHLRMLDVNMRVNCRMSRNRGLETADFGILQVTCPQISFCSVAARLLSFLRRSVRLRELRIVDDSGWHWLRIPVPVYSTTCNFGDPNFKISSYSQTRLDMFEALEAFQLTYLRGP